MTSNISKKQIIHRFKIIEGQMRGLEELLSKDFYCIDLIIQSSAIRRALLSVEDILMKNHLSICAISKIRKGDEKGAVEEILKIYTYKSR
jgi:DNA-binding FrmR family transcriptional regulator